LVPKVFSNSNKRPPPETELRNLGSYVQEAELDAGVVKVVIRADFVHMYCAPDRRARCILPMVAAKAMQMKQK
jgi:hypothetical protein